MARWWPDQRTQSKWQSGMNFLASTMVVLVCLAMLTDVVRGWMGGTTALTVASRSTRTAGHPPPPPAPSVPAAPISLAGAMMTGNTAATVAILEYSDYQCPFCGTFARDVFPEIDKAFIRTGKIRFIYRDFPLESIHPNALSAAVSARCAGEQGKFWEMQQLLFGNQKDLTGPRFVEWATQLGVDPRKFSACQTAAVAGKARADEDSGKALSVTGTPTFFIGLIQPDGSLKAVKRFSGAKPFKDFEGAIAPLLSSHGTPSVGVR